MILNLKSYRNTKCRELSHYQLISNDILQFFKDNIHNKYNIYYFGFIFCEFLNLVVVCLAMALTHKFLEHRFIFYGFKVWTYYG